MLNKVFLEGIIAQKPIRKTAINGSEYTIIILICKVDQEKISIEKPIAMLYPDDIIPIMVFKKEQVDWLVSKRGVGDVISVEGKIKTPKRNPIILGEHIKLIKSHDYAVREREIREQILKERNNESKSNNS